MFGSTTRMKALTPSRFVAGTVLIVSCLVLAGCSTPKASRSQGDFDVIQRVSFWQPHRLYLQASPCPRLYVEVDAMEGCSPSEAALKKLQGFLNTYCHKPGGIEIVRGDVIPAKAVRGLSAGAIAHKFLNGPPDSPTAPPPAFLYVLYYDSTLRDNPVVAKAGQHGADTLRRPHARAENPHVNPLPYPGMIYMNTHYGPKWLQDELLLHEAGHVLGLAGRTNYASGYHCLDANCRMYRTLCVRLNRLLTGRDPITQRQLCQRCLAQLADNSTQAPPANLRFAGPVLVRSEAGYHVLSLPDRVKFLAGDLAEQDCRAFAAAVRAEKPAPGDDEMRVDGTAKEEVLRDPAKMREIFPRAEADPFEPVRSIVPKLWAACAGKYYADRQFTNALNICREAIRSNPKDDWNYNLLAWIKATCSDPSVRDGQEAVAAATKACELAEWKNWNWIDTLAAACAEAGDFKRAIELEEQALRTGNPPESLQKEMRERIALYKQSRPFRSKP